MAKKKLKMPWRLTRDQAAAVAAAIAYLSRTPFPEGAKTRIRYVIRRLRDVLILGGWRLDEVTWELRPAESLGALEAKRKAKWYAIPFEEFREKVESYWKKVWKKLKENEDWFRNLWEAEADEYEFYELARHIVPNLDFETFDKGWQYRLVLHPDYKQALIEFFNILIGWW